MPQRLSKYLPLDRARFWLGVRVGLVTAAVVLFLWWGDLFVQTRLRFNNVYYVPRTIQDRKITIIAIDDASLKTYGRSLVTWPRTLYADLVDRLSANGARVIAFDVLFAEPAEGDDRLIDAITRARTDSEMRTRVVMPVVGGQRETGRDTVAYTYFLTPSAALQDTVTALGHTSILPDADGTVRHQPTQIRSGDDSILSFGIVTYLTYLRVPPAAFSQVAQFSGDELHLASDRRIPIDDLGQMWINYFDAPGKGAYEVFSFQDVLNDRVDPAVFYDRIVLVGLLGHTGLDDVYPVPIGLSGSVMAGVEIHANVIETLLANKPLDMQSRLSQAMMIVALALVAAVLYSFAAQRWYWLLLVLIGALVVWCGGVFIYFNLTQHMINLFHALLALVIPFPGVIIANAILETRRRQRAEWLRESMVMASTQQLSLERVLFGISGDVRRLLKTDEAAIWLVDPVKDDLVQAYPAEPNPLPERQALIRRATQRQTRLYEAGQLVEPVVWQGQVLGAFWARRKGRLSPATGHLLDVFSWQTASVLSNVRLYTQTQELSELKTRMIRMASHDLKNPLSAIIGYVDLMSDQYNKDRALPGEHRDWLSTIRVAAYNILAIVDDILNLERVRSRQRGVESVDLLYTLRRSVTAHQVSIAQKQHTLTLDLPETFPEVVGDPTQLREVFNNLLSNAIKYTPSGGQITLRLTQTGDKALITVADTGYGIPKDAQEKLFQEFYRVSTPETEDIDGTGLGLSLVKAVVESHQGRVWVESEEGSGSTFFVELPFGV